MRIGRTNALKHPMIFMAVAMCALVGCGDGGSKSGSSVSSSLDEEVVMTINDSVGRQFDAPGPRSCAGTPGGEALNAAQARALVICFAEGPSGNGDTLRLVRDVRVAAGATREQQPSDWHPGIDPSRAVQDITVSATEYRCGANTPATIEVWKAQCLTGRETSAPGVCYHTDGRGWACYYGNRTFDMTTAQPSAPPDSDS